MFSIRGLGVENKYNGLGSAASTAEDFRFPSRNSKMTILLPAISLSASFRPT